MNAIISNSIFFVSLFLTIFFGIVNITRMFYKNSISWKNNLSLALGVLGVVLKALGYY